MSKNRIDVKNLMLKKSLAIILSTSLGFTLLSDIGFDSNLISKIRNNRNDTTYVDDSLEYEKNLSEDITHNSVLDDNINTKSDDNKESNTTIKKDVVSKKDVVVEQKKEETNQIVEPEDIKEKVEEKEEEVQNEVIDENDDSLYEYKVNTELKKSFSTLEDGCLCIQGASIVGDSIIVARKRLDSDKTQLYKINRETYEIEGIVKDNYLGHCNDITYNSKMNCILTVGKNDYKDVVILDADTLQTIIEFESPHKYFALAYDESTNNYIALGGQNLYVLNQFFEEISCFNIPTNLTKQGVAVKDGLVYFLCWEKGVVSRYQTSIDIKRANTNYIFVYDYFGNLKTTYYLPNFKGEGEAIMFDSDGNLLVSVNGKTIADWQIYSVDIDKDSYISKDKIKEK